MKTITKSQAIELLKGIKPTVACWTPVQNERWEGKFDLSFRRDFSVVAVCEFGEEPHYAAHPTQVYFKEGILTIITPHDTRVKGFWGGCVSGEICDVVEEYRVV
ncbi:MAG: hypothetical protein IRZ03_18935 [Acidobacterium ailaaui]|nr:hypothetical protein [Pseudacidobacterium ailaaui]